MKVGDEVLLKSLGNGRVICTCTFYHRVMYFLFEITRVVRKNIETLHVAACET
jgi:hypothetical protein